jgi:hypothetical protein
VTPVSDFKLQAVSGRPETETPCSSLLWDDSPVNLTLKGTVLEAQFICQNKYLLVTTEGIPYEEGLHFYVLSPSFEILDEAEISAMYAGGIFTDVSYPDEASLEFSFFGKDRWRLTVLPVPRFVVRSEIMSSVKRPWGRLLSKKHLALKRLR